MKIPALSEENPCWGCLYDREDIRLCIAEGRTEVCETEEGNFIFVGENE